MNIKTNFSKKLKNFINKIKKNKLYKRLVWISGSIILFLLIVTIIINICAGNFIENKVNTYLSEHPVEPYSITFDKISVNIFNRSVKIKNLNIVPDSLILNNTKNTGKKYSNLFEVQIPYIKLSGIKILKAYKNKIVDINKFIIKKPDIKVFNLKSLPKTNTHKKASKKLNFDSLNIKPLHSIIIDKFNIDKCSVEVFELNSKTPTISIASFSLLLTDLIIDPDNSGKDKRIISAEDFTIKIKDHNYILPGNLYKIHFDKAGLCYSKSNLFIKSFELIPLYDRVTFGQKTEYQTDYTELTIKNIKFINLDFDELIFNKKFNLGFIDIRGLKTNIYRDKRLPFNFNHFPKLYNESIHNMEFPVNIDTIYITNAKVTYEEQVEKAAKPGMVFFDKMNVLVVNITNDPEKLKKNKSMKIYSTSMLMNKGLLKAKIFLPLTGKIDTFLFSGSLGYMKMEKLNTITIPNASVKIIKGNVKSVNFSANANNNYAKGRMEFLYEDLDVVILKNIDGEEVKEKKIFSFVANKIIKKSNPIADKPPRIAEMYFERDKNKGIFNYIWKTVFSGIKATASPGKKHLVDDSKEKVKAKK